MRTLGSYELIRHIGSGGMAEVWLGRRSAIGGARKRLAIKLLAKHLADAPRFRQLFLAEARMSMLLSHSNIVQVFDVGEDEGESYMVMELVEGASLAKLTQALRDAGEQLPVHVATYIVGEVLRALAYAHELEFDGEERAIVHRDVSPSNVMLSIAGEVKLMDFGIARFASEQTGGTQVKGKLRYMPPEQLRGDSHLPSIDLFAVGAILHELLSGQRFRGEVVDEVQLYGIVLDAHTPSLPKTCAAPAEVEALRRALLAADPGERPQSARAALEQLRRWSGYRDASMELESLVRRHFKNHDVSPAIPDEVTYEPSSANEPRAAEPRTEVSVLAATAVEHTGPALVAGGLEQKLVATGIEHVAPRAAPGRRPRRLGLVLGLVGALVIAGVGVGLTLSFGGRDHAEPPAVMSPPAPVPAPVPTKAAVPEAPLPDVPVPEPRVPPPDPEAPPPVEPVEPVEPEQPAESDELAPTRVSVEFVANDYFYVEIRLGSRGQAIALEPRKKLMIRPGSHTLYLRQGPDDTWKRAGRITLEAEHSYQVDMLDPPGAKLIAR